MRRALPHSSLLQQVNSLHRVQTGDFVLLGFLWSFARLNSVFLRVECLIVSTTFRRDASESSVCGSEARRCRVARLIVHVGDRLSSVFPC